MKRILATAGIAGLALIGVTAPASAGGDKISICHATGSEKDPYVEITSPENTWLDGHNGREDIYPVPAKRCEERDHEKPPAEKPPAEKPPVEKPPAEKPPAEKPPAEKPPAVTPPVVTPPAVTPPAVVPPAVVPPVVVPAVVIPAGAAAAPAPVVNRGFNAQTAAGSQPQAGIPAWFGGLGALLTAVAAVALRRGRRRQDISAAD